jgi:hypothetical protein
MNKGIPGSKYLVRSLKRIPKGRFEKRNLELGVGKPMWLLKKELLSLRSKSCNSSPNANDLLI